MKKQNLTQAIAFGAIAIALSASLNFVKFKVFPTGGSVTLLRMLPLVIYAYMFGLPWGFFIGALFGVVDGLIDPWIVHPLQYILDYPLQFAFAGLAGLFRNSSSRNKILYGCIFVTVGRVLSCFTSGLIWFTSFTELGIIGGIWYSLSYQLLTIVPDMVLVMVAVFVLERHKPFMNYINGVKNRQNPKENSQENPKETD